MTYLEFREMQKQKVTDTTGYLSPDVRSLQDLIKVEGTKIIAHNEPLQGKYGYIVFVPKYNSEGPRTLYLMRKVYEEPKQIRIGNRKEFERILNNALINSYKVELCELPAQLLCGFLVFKKNEVFWYHISFVALKDAGLEDERKTWDSSGGFRGRDRT